MVEKKVIFWVSKYTQNKFFDALTYSYAITDKFCPRQGKRQSSQIPAENLSDLIFKFVSM